MGRKCKTCESTLRDEIDAMIMSGANWKYLEAWCGDRGLKITETALRNHAKAHIKGYEAPLTHEIKAAPQEKQLAKFDPDPTVVDFERYYQDIGLNQDDWSDIENNISACQKAASLIFFKLTAIADQKLQDYSLGKTRYPTEQIKALKLGYEVYCKAIGLENIIDENTAIKTLESLGYRIQK
ncbi:MAG: hypothetical protein ACRC80_22470 [Waterburya sp.]